MVLGLTGWLARSAVLERVLRLGANWSVDVELLWLRLLRWLMLLVSAALGHCWFTGHPIVLCCLLWLFAWGSDLALLVDHLTWLSLWRLWWWTGKLVVYSIESRGQLSDCICQVASSNVCLCGYAKSRGMRSRSLSARMLWSLPEFFIWGCSSRRSATSPAR